MEHNLLFSLIVPVYNVSKYLHQCLDSIINQTYSNIEIILVNDGSSDYSGRICDEYANKDKRIKTIHTENKGVSSARNLGLSIAKGNYIAFIDSDDWIEKDAIEKIEKQIKTYSYDLILYGVSRDTLHGQFPLYTGLVETSYTLKDQMNDILPYLVKNEIINAPFKVYKHDLIKDNNIKFDTNFSLAEDYLFNIDFFLKANSLLIDPDYYYHYMIRENTSLSRKFQTDKYEKLMQVNCKIKEIMINLETNENLKDALLYIRLKNVYSCFTDIFKEECNYSYKEKLLFIKKILKNEKDIEYISISDKKFRILSLLVKLNNARIMLLVSKIIYDLKSFKNKR